MCTNAHLGFKAISQKKVPINDIVRSDYLMLVIIVVLTITRKERASAAKMLVPTVHWQTVRNVPFNRISNHDFIN